MFLFLVLWLLIRRQNWRTSVPPNSVALFFNYHQYYKSTRAISHNSDVTFVLTRWTAKFLPSPHCGTRMNHESFSSLFFSFSMVGSRPGISWIWLFTHNGTVTCLFKIIAAMLHWNQVLKKKIPNLVTLLQFQSALLFCPVQLCVIEVLVWILEACKLDIVPVIVWLITTTSFLPLL